MDHVNELKADVLVGKKKQAALAKRAARSAQKELKFKAQLEELKQKQLLSNEASHALERFNGKHFCVHFSVSFSYAEELHILLFCRHVYGRVL